MTKEMVSLPRSHELMAVLATNVNWGEVPNDVCQDLINDPQGAGRKFAAFLKNGGRVKAVTIDDIIVPQGGQTYDLSVTVDESRNWREAINTAGPDTSSNNNVWRVGDWYPTQNVNGTQQIVLVNFGKIMTSQGVLDWAKTNHLRPASPRVVFAVGEHQPKLDKTLGMNPMAIVSLQDCSFGGCRRVCFVWWYASLRRVGLVWLDYDWGDCCWFAFVRE
ncbi:MAG: hypothetical protein Q8Q37_02615 [bacterium]|nr:hypothetical protein [bacterium]